MGDGVEMNYWVIALTEEERDLILSLLENREKYCGEAAFQNLPKYQIGYWKEQQHRASMLANRIKGAEKCEMVFGKGPQDE